MGAIRALVVEGDERWKGEVLATCAEAPYLHLVGAPVAAEETGLAIHRLRPDVVFFTTRASWIDAMRSVEGLGEASPVLLLVCDSGAVALRPFERERSLAEDALRGDTITAALAWSLPRSLRPAARAAGSRVPAPSGQPTPRRHLRRIPVRVGSRHVLVRTEDVHCIEAEGNYVRIHTGEGDFVLREVLGALEPKLDPGRFLRIHRSSIVNVEEIASIESWNWGEYLLVLRSGRKLTSSRRYRSHVQALVDL